MQLNEQHREHWRKNTALTVILLAIWFVATFVVNFFARELSFNFLGWPFSFWMNAQGLLVLFVVLTRVYAQQMQKLDRQYGVAEGDE
jgi:putative solute:sodium symporter small subunit